MPVRCSAADRGAARGRRLVADLLRDAEARRLDAGLSLADVGRPMGITAQQVGRILRNASPEVSVVRVSQLLAVLGLELSARAYPVGPAIRDAAQLALLDRFHARLHPDLVWRLEVPVIELPMPGSVDLRAWDAAVDGPGWTLRVDAETRTTDLQALQRRIGLKQRDGRIELVVLLLSDTRWHRAVLREAGSALRAQFPVGTRGALQALSRGLPPAGNAIVVL
jgi:transcriptional regulator with XRE-family HTH domain